MGKLYEHFLDVGDELDVMTRRSFVSGETVSMIGSPLPHEAFEWMALFDALAEARTHFTMLELGAGFGRWTVRAAASTRRYRPDLTYRLVAVEAEPTHFQWLALHTVDNAISRKSSAGTCELVNAAVSSQSGDEQFYFGNPAAWYGQALVRSENAGADAPAQPVRTVRLSSLVERLDRVDLIDLDIQGAELEVLTEAAPSLGHVHRAYVETHSKAIDEELPNVFEYSEGDWSLIEAAPLGARRMTPLGEALFAAGGAQLWANRNPRDRDTTADLGNET